MMLVLCLLPSGSSQNWTPVTDTTQSEGLKSAVMSVGLMVLYGLLITLFSVFGSQSYGTALFAGAPSFGSARGARSRDSLRSPRLCSRGGSLRRLHSAHRPGRCWFENHKGPTVAGQA